jgi:hypothetical protein
MLSSYARVPALATILRQHANTSFRNPCVHSAPDRYQRRLLVTFSLSGGAGIERRVVVNNLPLAVVHLIVAEGVSKRVASLGRLGIIKSKGKVVKSNVHAPFIANVDIAFHEFELWPVNTTQLKKK